MFQGQLIRNEFNELTTSKDRRVVYVVAVKRKLMIQRAKRCFRFHEACLHLGSIILVGISGSRKVKEVAPRFTQYVS